MKAITILQPWASLIARGHKRIETRGWYTEHRGPIAIHAGKSREYAWVVRGNPYDQLGLADLPLGAVVATARLVACVRITRSDTYQTADGRLRVELTAHERALGDHTPGRWAWVLDDVQRLPDPIPARGKQGLWEWAESVRELRR